MCIRRCITGMDRHTTAELDGKLIFRSFVANIVLNIKYNYYLFIINSNSTGNFQCLIKGKETRGPQCKMVLKIKCKNYINGQVDKKITQVFVTFR